LESKLSEVPRESADRGVRGQQQRGRERGMKNKSKEEKTTEKYWRKL
jgi:hypothetical protein